jgi:hypothetical protein
MLEHEWFPNLSRCQVGLSRRRLKATVCLRWRQGGGSPFFISTWASCSRLHGRRSHLPRMNHEAGGAAVDGPWGNRGPRFACADRRCSGRRHEILQLQDGNMLQPVDQFDLRCYDPDRHSPDGNVQPALRHSLPDRRPNVIRLGGYFLGWKYDQCSPVGCVDEREQCDDIISIRRVSRNHLHPGPNRPFTETIFV